MYWKTVWLAYWYLYFLSVPHLCSYWLQMDIFCFYFYIPGLEFLPLHFIRQLLASDTQSEFFIGQFPFSNLGAEIALNRGCQMHITRFELYMNLHNGFCRFVLGYLCAFGLPFVLSLFRWLNQILLNPWWKQYALWVVTAEIMFSLHSQLEAVTCKNSHLMGVHLGHWILGVMVMWVLLMCHQVTSGLFVFMALGIINGNQFVERWSAVKPYQLCYSTLNVFKVSNSLLVPSIVSQEKREVPNLPVFKSGGWSIS
jgi:hypothetical protein